MTEDSSTTAIAKRSLRASLLKNRQALSTTEWQQKSLQLCGHLQRSSLFLQAQTVLAYFSVRQEPDLSSLFIMQKNWGFPRCVGTTLSWHAWSPADRYALQFGAYAIPEPRPDSPQVDPEQVDLVLVPSVACDRQGYRLGYGGGFYDRLLSSPDWQNKMTIGIVFDFAYQSELPVEAWDYPLKGVCTESGLFLV